jgi:sugar transferase (PEP-CTERM/EpsH1 system associated)
VACFAYGEEDLANAADFAARVASVDVVALSPTRARGRALKAVLTGEPLTVAYFNEKELHRRVRARLQDSRFDAILVYSSSMAQFVEDQVDVPRIMQFADLDSLKWEQYTRNAWPPMRWVYGLEAHRLLRYERHLAHSFAHSLVCTPLEAQDFQKLIPGAPVSCVGNGVNLDYFKPSDVPKKKNSLVFTGVMDYLPNVDGVVWFCREILPLVRAKIQEVTFTICGSRPSQAVQALQQIPGVTVTGRVPDVRPYLTSASVCVVPLRMGRGIQNKLLEAMATGLPAVATTTAFGGVEAVPGEELLVADEPEQFASSVVRLLENADVRRQMGQAARAAMEKHYNWKTCLAALDEVLESVTGARQIPGHSMPTGTRSPVSVRK